MTILPFTLNNYQLSVSSWQPARRSPDKYRDGGGLTVSNVKANAALLVRKMYYIAQLTSFRNTSKGGLLKIERLFEIPISKTKTVIPGNTTKKGTHEGIKTVSKTNRAIRKLPKKESMIPMPLPKTPK